MDGLLPGQDRCASIKPHLLAATADLVHSIPATNLHIVFQHTYDGCSVADAVAVAGSISDGGKLVAAVGSEASWWQHIAQLSYLQPSQHLLIGPLHWITGVMEKVNHLYLTGKINALTTRWIWLPTSVRTNEDRAMIGASPSSSPQNSPDHSLTHIPSLPSNPSNPSTSPQNSQNRTFADTLGSPPSPSPKNNPSASPQSQNPPTPPPPSSPETHILDSLSGAIVEGVRGVVLFIAKEGGKRGRKKIGEVRVGGMLSDGGGLWRLEVVGLWRQGMGFTLHHNKHLWPTLSYNLQQRLVRLICTTKPTVMELVQETGDLSGAKGYGADLTRLLMTRLNFTVAVKVVKGFGSITTNGSWNGMVGVLSRMEADMSTLDFSPSSERLQVLDFGEPYSMDGVVILSRAPSLLPRPFLLLNIFSPLVWACLMGSVLVSGMIGALMVAAEGGFIHDPHYHYHLDHPRRCATSIFKIFLYQSCRWWPRCSGARVVGAVSMLGALVVCSLYSGFITAFLAIPFRSAPVNSAEDLAASKMVPVFRARTTMYNFIIAQEGGILGQLRSRMKTVESQDLNTWSFHSSVADGTYAFLDTHSSVVGRARRFESEGSQCRFHLATQLVRLDLDCFAFARNSFIIHQVNEIMRRLRYGGLIQQLQKLYYQLPCETDLIRTGPQAMTLAQVQAAFYVMAVGVLVSAVALVGELLAGCVKSKKFCLKN